MGELVPVELVSVHLLEHQPDLILIDRPAAVAVVHVEREDGQRVWAHRAVVPQRGDELAEVDLAAAVLVLYVQRC